MVFGPVHMRVSRAATLFAVGVGAVLPQLVSTQTSVPPTKTILLPEKGWVRAFTVDTQRNIYIVGDTTDITFPVTPNAVSRTCGSDGQCGATYNPRRERTTHVFVMKIGPEGKIKLSTFLGGDGGQQADRIAVGLDGSIYIAGQFGAVRYPVPLQFPLYGSSATACGQSDAFVTRFDPAGSSLVFSTCLHGPSVRLTPLMVRGLAVDSDGSVIAGGSVNSPDFPVVNALQPVYRGFPAFVTKVLSSGRVAFSTFFGGSRRDTIWSLAVSRTGDIVIAGDTESQDLPIVRPLHSSLRGQTDAFVARLERDGRYLAFSTYLGGDGTDVLWDVTVDAQDRAWVVGDTHSLNYPTTIDGLQPIPPCGTDAWCAVRNPAGVISRFDDVGRLTYSTLVSAEGVSANVPGGARFEHVFAGPFGEVTVVGGASGAIRQMRPLTPLPCAEFPCGLMLTIAPDRSLRFASRLEYENRLVNFSDSAIGPGGELYVLMQTLLLRQLLTIVDVNDGYAAERHRR